MRRRAGFLAFQDQADAESLAAAAAAFDQVEITRLENAQAQAAALDPCLLHLRCRPHQGVATLAHVRGESIAEVGKGLELALGEDGGVSAFLARLVGGCDQATDQAEVGARVVEHHHGGFGRLGFQHGDGLHVGVDIAVVRLLLGHADASRCGQGQQGSEHEAENAVQVHPVPQVDTIEARTCVRVAEGWGNSPRQTTAAQ